MSRRRWRIAAIACALPAAMLLAGCGKKQAEQAVVGQVIAHVGPDDVTQQELDNELRLANVPADKRSDPILKAALSRIVERKYLVQQVLALDNARQRRLEDRVAALIGRHIGEAKLVVQL